MDLSTLPAPWGTILQLIVGPVGAIVLLCVIIWFLWKLFREEQVDNRKNLDTLSVLGQSVKDLTTEVKAWREASR